MSQKLLAWNLPRHKLIRHLFPPRLQTPELLVALIGNFPLTLPPIPTTPTSLLNKHPALVTLTKLFTPTSDIHRQQTFQFLSQLPLIGWEWDGEVFCSEADTHLITLRNVPILLFTILSQPSINSGINQPYRPAQPKYIYSEFCQKQNLTGWHLVSHMPFFFVRFPRKELKPNITVCWLR